MKETWIGQLLVHHYHWAPAGEMSAAWSGWCASLEAGLEEVEQS